jgi:hypothetical protein
VIEQLVGSPEGVNSMGSVNYSVPMKAAYYLCITKIPTFVYSQLLELIFLEYQCYIMCIV